MHIIIMELHTVMYYLDALQQMYYIYFNIFRTAWMRGCAFCSPHRKSSSFSVIFFFFKILEDSLAFISISSFHHIVFRFFRGTVTPLRSVAFSVLPLMKTWVLILTKHPITDPRLRISSVVWLSLLSSQTKTHFQGLNLHGVLFVRLFDFIFSRCLFHSSRLGFVFGWLNAFDRHSFCVLKVFPPGILIPASGK